ncbi:MAG: hypothetical protein ACK55Z_26465 [bacterium]
MEFVGFGQYISEFTLNNMPGTRWQAGNTVAFQGEKREDILRKEKEEEARKERIKQKLIEKDNFNEDSEIENKN